jgi:hypothetical protein
MRALEGILQNFSALSACTLNHAQFSILFTTVNFKYLPQRAG